MPGLQNNKVYILPSYLPIGSKNTVFANRTSGIHKAQTTCAQVPLSVCLNAPPWFGHKTQSTALLGDCKHLIKIILLRV